MFVVHGTSIYGASRSIELALRGLVSHEFITKEEIKFVFQRYFRKSKSKLELPFFWELRNRSAWILPSMYFSDGSLSKKKERFIRMLRLAYAIIFSIPWIFKYKRELNGEKIDLIHLNSLALWSMLLYLPKKIPVSIHAREIFEESVEARIALSLMKKRDVKILSISADCAIPLEKEGLKVEVLENPFDMREAVRLRIYSQEALKNKYGLSSEKTIISIIGRLMKEKGIEFFIQAARELRKDDSLYFLIVGGRKDSLRQKYYFEEMLERSKDLGNIAFIEETERIEEVYALSEIVVRCEKAFALGRTLLEGYYAGCKVLAPYAAEEELRLCRNTLPNAYVYKARDLEDFVREIYKARDDESYLPPDETDNTREYSNKFYEFLRKVSDSQ